MKDMASSSVVLTLGLGLVVFLASFAGFCNGSLQVGFYRGKCGFHDVESIVARVVTSRFVRDATIVAALIRLQFHDCFVTGCDGSILLDGRNSEKTAFPNLSMRGYDIIDRAKRAVERACPGIVSCADLIAIAARDAVFLSGGGRYHVQTGRRDSFFSHARNVTLPGPSTSVSQSLVGFANKGLTANDMVILLGAHSVGVAHCSFFKDRLYNFKNSGRPDPNMDLFQARMLRRRCRQNSTRDNTVNLDQNPFSLFTLDNSFYQNLLLTRGILQIDQDLASDPSTRNIVRNLANSFDFPARLGAAMVRLGAIEVLTGNQGEIRRSC